MNQVRCKVETSPNSDLKAAFGELQICVGLLNETRGKDRVESQLKHVKTLVEDLLDDDVEFKSVFLLLDTCILCIFETI